MKTLHLLPNVLHEAASFEFHPPQITALIAESDKGGYAWLKRFGLPRLPVHLLNEHTKDLSALLQIPEEAVGLISDAGLPCLADPGASLVEQARKKGVAVKAYPGPSSILLALMLSGLPAQSFTFHGYLERDGALLKKQIRGLARDITHLFIEAPYRNLKLLEALLQELHPQDKLAVAWDLTGPEEGVMSERVELWRKKTRPPIDRRPAVFIFRKT